MTDDWHFMQRNERHGPVPFARLERMARDGWLARTDLVWRAGLAGWTPAGDIDGLFPPSMAATIRKVVRRAGLTRIAALLHAAPQPPGDDVTSAQDLPPPSPARRGSRSGAGPRAGADPRPGSQRAAGGERARRDRRGTRTGSRRAAARGANTRGRRGVDAWRRLTLRHLVAAAGGFLAALGIAFTAIARSQVALAFLGGGLALMAGGLSVELAALCGAAARTVGRRARERADRRLRPRSQPLETPGPRPGAAQPADAVASPAHGSFMDGEGTLRERPPPRHHHAAAIMSLVLPGLGQCAKGQMLPAIAWFAAAMLGYTTFVLPGLLLHAFCVIDAWGGHPPTRDGTTGTAGE